MKEGTRRWKAFLCSWIERINVVKITIFTKSNSETQWNPNQISMLFSTEVMIGGSENIRILGRTVIVTRNS